MFLSILFKLQMEDYPDKADNKIIKSKIRVVYCISLFGCTLKSEDQGRIFQAPHHYEWQMHDAVTTSAELVGARTKKKV